ncbi:MAG: thiamine pyrophosphate-binding protein [Betaproteobacteria bacterium]|nr:thiamine pyrophosphate-binding protein [Betaproteobacteria bacterium]
MAERGEAVDWPRRIHAVLKEAGIGVVGYVPDAGHKRLIELCHADPGLRTVVLSTEEEGIGLAAGAWLGGARSVLLMQSSGVGNCVNALGTVKECRFPLVLIVTMRGEYGEFNPWQVPMGQATARVLEAMGVVVHKVARPEEVAPAVDAAARLAYGGYSCVAVLVSQAVIGIKSFQEQAAQ